MSFTPPAVWATPRHWTRENSNFFISNDPAILSVETVKEAFGSEFVYWADDSIPDEVLQQMLYGSMSFGVYERTNNEDPSPSNTKQIGLARMVTDGSTFAYLSDVYVLPQYQGNGLGTWLIDCIVEVFSKEKMPYLRRIMLMTGNERTRALYARKFNMEVVGSEERPDLGLDLEFLCARPNAKRN